MGCFTILHFFSRDSICFRGCSSFATKFVIDIEANWPGEQFCSSWPRLQNSMKVAANSKFNLSFFRFFFSSRRFFVLQRRTRALKIFKFFLARGGAANCRVKPFLQIISFFRFRKKSSKVLRTLFFEGGSEKFVENLRKNRMVLVLQKFSCSKKLFMRVCFWMVLTIFLLVGFFLFEVVRSWVDKHLGGCSSGW